MVVFAPARLCLQGPIVMGPDRENILTEVAQESPTTTIPGKERGPTIMNPERERMLAQIAREEAAIPPVAVKLEKPPPPPVSGANCAPVGRASSGAPNGSAPTPIRDGGDLPLVGGRTLRGRVIPFSQPVNGQTSMMPLPPPPPLGGSLKRPASVVVSSGGGGPQKKKKKKNPATPLPQKALEIPRLPPAPHPNEHTRYLESLLRTQHLDILLHTVKEEGADPRKLIERRISRAGLLQADEMSLIQGLHAVPISREGATSATNTLRLKMEGVILEDLWPRLGKDEKSHYAAQLRKIVNRMRSENSTGKARSLGSINAGRYSLVLDKHPDHTYYAVRSGLESSDFTAFLLSSFYESVPPTVQKALISHLSSKSRLVIAHGELSPRNIVVNNGGIVGILGWDCSGWYPDWWEYVKFFEARTLEDNDDWYDYASQIFTDEYPKELAAYQGILGVSSLLLLLEVLDFPPDVPSVVWRREQQFGHGV
ncbi:hypothetical protein G7046_g8309 [Stylonectria norvegica]|nr:hypothetical protein G7046_g8309 [Stylonectria norvegica]